ncbi:hypothetical protein [Nocardioides jejuensis]|uniref:Uncharacterized protein n=1 Tax=Nocardioides jejuensis TaxID=2502782 RepID=A0A4R1CHV1_9ACTN|nr:hypothetical protein [Nocardioides jejuensis]TCJ31014.1 hypothetical protein EPD65_00085 [Nocardioides jejuensis]
MATRELELSLRETRALKAAFVVAGTPEPRIDEVAIRPGRRRLVMESTSLSPICRSLIHVAREVPDEELRARVGIARPELDALYTRVVAHWAMVAGF